jgi:hypothetical protein
MSRLPIHPSFFSIVAFLLVGVMAAAPLLERMSQTQTSFISKEIQQESEYDSDSEDNRPEFDSPGFCADFDSSADKFSVQSCLGYSCLDMLDPLTTRFSVNSQRGPPA